ncbi:MAG: DUF1800 domain-containing protein [Bryobacteraceae bacterium]|jgi:uncharacterized protein (DUF1800 family)
MRPSVTIALVAASLVAALPLLEAWDASKPAREPEVFVTQIAPADRLQQALNRLTYGPRPGDVERVRAIGLEKWIERQLHPESIPENPELSEKLRYLDTLDLSSSQLVLDYPSPEVVRQMVMGQIPYPTDPEIRMMIAKMVARTEQKQGQDAAAADPNAPQLQRLEDLLTEDQIRSLRTGTPEQRLAAFQALPADKQDDAIMAMGPGMRQALFAAAPPSLRRKLELANGPVQVVARDLAEAKVLRAIYSERQLAEVLDDFWFNHFNVFFDKGADRYLVTAYERDAIRPHVLGKFRDLLEATAQSPAMLFYLDNWQSVGTDAPQPRQAKQARRGLNENYGRELMELHTLGVNGGYTQKDVTEVARCFTGWTIYKPQMGGRFFFNARLHDNGQKVVLGVAIPAGGGMADGEKVLDILARRPSTAHFISRELAERFVADDPPQALVDRMADTFLSTDGDVRQVLETMFHSKEFWSVGAYRSKVKSPFEMVASAVRASGGNVDFAAALVNQVAQMGEPLYRKMEPTGYSNSSQEWMNAGGLLARMNFAVQLAGGRLPGVKLELADNTNPGALREGVQLGSPEFQKH